MAKNLRERAAARPRAEKAAWLEARRAKRKRVLPTYKGVEVEVVREVDASQTLIRFKDGMEIAVPSVDVHRHPPGR